MENRGSPEWEGKDCGDVLVQWHPKVSPKTVICSVVSQQTIGFSGIVQSPLIKTLL